jgi:hypothetical protein
LPNKPLQFARFARRWTAAIAVMAILTALLSSNTAELFGIPAARWPEQMIGIWKIPSNSLARLLLMGFTAVIFGGEYQWHTWKNIVPRHGRLFLILAKFFTLAAFITVAFAVAVALLQQLGQLAAVGYEASGHA